MTGFFFLVFPYLALGLAIGGGLYRYFVNPFTYSSLSSQLVEPRWLFWGSVPWHYGIVPILLAHLLAGLFPRVAEAILRHPVPLAVLELLGFALALFTVVGVVILIVRRGAHPAARAVTSSLDWILLVLLAVQVILGLAIALSQRWGSRWYLATAVPWFWSLVRLAPDARTVTPLPGLVQAHFVNGFLIILLFPFTRLVHLVSIPLGYLWRPYQVVTWNHPRPATGRSGGAHARPGAGGGGPSRPDPPEADPDPQRSRRRFLVRLSIGLGAVAAAVVAVPALGFLLGLRKAPQVWRAVGKVDDFATGTTREVSFLDPSPLPWSGVSAKTAAWLRRESSREFVAFAVNCTHLGCPVRWLEDAELFMCPCHGGVFYKDGRVAAGPPPRSLSRYPVRVRGDVVEILTSPLPIT